MNTEQWALNDDNRLEHGRSIVERTKNRPTVLWASESANLRHNRVANRARWIRTTKDRVCFGCSFAEWQRFLGKVRIQKKFFMFLERVFLKWPNSPNSLCVCSPPRPASAIRKLSEREREASVAISGMQLHSVGGFSAKKAKNLPALYAAIPAAN